MTRGQGGPKPDRQQPIGSMSDCITIVLKKILPNSNCQEPGGSTYDHITLVLNKIRHIRTRNNITSPLNNNMHKTEIMQKYNGLHQTYIDITKNTYTSERYADLL